MRERTVFFEGGRTPGFFRLAAVGALALLCGISGPGGGGGAVWAAEGAGVAKRPAQAWPANVHLVEARLAPSELQRLQSKLEVPQLRIYDRQGRLLYDWNGYWSGTADAALRKALAFKPLPAPAGNPLAEELKRFQSLDGKALDPLPDTELRIVEWWAEWCVPCHAQAKELAEALGKTPQTKVALVHVDIVPPGTIVRKFVADESKLTPEQRRKLSDPNTPAAEKQKIRDSAPLKEEGAMGEGVPPPRR